MTGFIGVGQLRYSTAAPENVYCQERDTNIYAVLTNLGEKMSDDEVDELLKAVDTSSGEINYVGKQTPRCPSQVYRMN